MEYTIEQFENDFENAPFDQKGSILLKAIDSFDLDEQSKWKESILKHKEELQDLKTQREIDRDLECIKEIESGNLDIYTCIKSCSALTPNAFCFTEGQNYYVKIKDYGAGLRDKWITEGDSGSDKYQEMIKVINEMTPLVWIYFDNGIGTLKKKTPFNFDKFPNHFKRFQNNL